MTTLFVTSSGTDVGKTFVVLQLIAELEAAGFGVRALKPVASGFEPGDLAASDTGLLLRAQRFAATADNLDRVSPWRFAAPLSPDMAAARERRSIDFRELLEFCRRPRDVDVTLIEGVGGVMVPLDDRHTTLDWIVELGQPVLLVVGSYLGSLSHSLTAVKALRDREVAVAGVVISQSLAEPATTEETAAVLERFVAEVPVRVLPRGTFAPLLPLVAPLLP